MGFADLVQLAQQPSVANLPGARDRFINDLQQRPSQFGPDQTTNNTDYMLRAIQRDHAVSQYDQGMRLQQLLHSATGRE